MSQIRAFLELTRPANVITALTDIMAGMAIVGFLFVWKDYSIQPLLLLGFSTMCLYAGGVVFNDVFDRELDSFERPERALPSGRISLQTAVAGGLILLILGIFLAFKQSLLSGYVAIIITLLALFYDWKGKHMQYFGPINMGLCRAFNLLLGMSVYELGVIEQGQWMILPLIYIAAITMVSRGEVHGSTPWPIAAAAFFFLIIHAAQLSLAIKSEQWIAIPFIILHITLIFRPLIKAYQHPIGPNIGKTVKAGVLSLIVMNAAWVSLSGQWMIALAVLALLPISMRVGKFFAVT
ncbi:UbiA-like protein EboC [Aquirufa nivalisilvae]